MSDADYCTFCGSLMREEKRPTGEYDRRTGKEIIETGYICPRWSSFLGCCHTNDFERDEND